MKEYQKKKDDEEDLGVTSLVEAAPRIQVTKGVLAGVSVAAVI